QRLAVNSCPSLNYNNRADNPRGRSSLAARSSATATSRNSLEGPIADLNCRSESAAYSAHVIQVLERHPKETIVDRIKCTIHFLSCSLHAPKTTSKFCALRIAFLI